LNSKDGIILQDEIVIDNWKSRVGDIKKDEPDNKDFVICSGGH
jgi:hypothetical protein